MMDKISFESRYKFIVSIGGVLLILPFTILYGIMKLSNDLIISNETINGLTRVSKEIIEKKQNVFLNTINSTIFYIFLILLFLVGIVCVIKGLIDWGNIQQKEDHKKDLENEKLELENEKLKSEYGVSNKEKLNKVEQEIYYEQEILGRQNSKISSQEYYKVEQLVASKVIKDFSKTHDVVYGFRLGNFQYDIVAKGRGFLDKDYFFEIKYLRANIRKFWFEQIIDRTEQQKENYMEKTSRIPYIKIVIVTEEQNYDQVKVFIDKQDKVNNLCVVVVRKNEINNFNFK